MKVLYFDTETTGLDKDKNGLIQISGIIEIDGVVTDSFNFKIAPFEKDIIEPDALKVNKTTIEEILTYPKPNIVYSQLLQLFDKYIDKYNKDDKFFPAGYNIKFDLEFLSSFFKKNNNLYFGSYCNWHGIDGLSLVHYMEYLGGLKLKNYKLGTLCEYFDIQLNAHDANEDITATRELILKIKEKLVLKQEELELPF